jgi:ketosteroid isomerase-like protein
MSQENVELVKAVLDAYNREDWTAVFRDIPPDAELDMSRAVGPIQGVFKPEQVRRVLVDFRENWESVRIEPHEFIGAGDLVVVPWTMHVKGRDGIEAAARVAVVWTVRDGVIQGASLYQERQDALEAVGLSEQDAHAGS